MIDIGRSNTMLIPNRHIEVADGQISTKCISLALLSATHTHNIAKVTLWRNNTFAVHKREERNSTISNAQQAAAYNIHSNFCVLALSSSIEPGYAVLNVFINAAAET
jgi:hypothetical protein